MPALSSSAMAWGVSGYSLVVGGVHAHAFARLLVSYRPLAVCASATRGLEQAYGCGDSAAIALIREAPLISAQGGESAAEREAPPPSERAFSALTSSAHGEA